MPVYTRAFVPGGTFFFTLVTERRRPVLIRPEVRAALRRAVQMVKARYPFRLDAVVLLPDHLHAIWTLPKDDGDFSTRWRLIKSYTTHGLSQEMVATGALSPSRCQKGERSLWQRRFWEHTVRDEPELWALCDYIHYNPVKHGHASCPHAWPWSSFSRFVKERRYALDWQCACLAGVRKSFDTRNMDEVVGE